MRWVVSPTRAREQGTQHCTAFLSALVKPPGSQSTLVNAMSPVPMACGVGGTTESAIGSTGRQSRERDEHRSCSVARLRALWPFHARTDIGASWSPSLAFDATGRLLLPGVVVKCEIALWLRAAFVIGTAAAQKVSIKTWSGCLRRFSGKAGRMGWVNGAEFFARVSAFPRSIVSPAARCQVKPENSTHRSNMARAGPTDATGQSGFESGNCPPPKLRKRHRDRGAPGTGAARPKPGMLLRCARIQT